MRDSKCFSVFLTKNKQLESLGLADGRSQLGQRRRGQSAATESHSHAGGALQGKEMPNAFYAFYFM